MAVNRSNRRHGKDTSNNNDDRDNYEHDYDRLIYSSHLRRLANVTQIFNPSEGVIFHNRLTHTLKVSQIATRIAQKFLSPRYVDRGGLKNIGGLNKDVVATAALAHDLGNPPFGHAAESELNRIITIEHKILDGFEGNAQSFRIVTKLACHNNNYPGMNLTRATLNAILKYPFPRKDIDQKKFGFYNSEIDDFNYARGLTPNLGDRKCLEASIMDISDDITYGIHDLLDLLKQELIPMTQLARTTKELSSRLKNTPLSYSSILNEVSFPQFAIALDLIKIGIKSHEEWAPKWPTGENGVLEKITKFFKVFEYIFPRGAYHGFQSERNHLKYLESFFLQIFLDNICININPSDNEPVLYLNEDAAEKLIIIKAITRSYILNSTSLIRQQRGERMIIQELFRAFTEAIKDDDLRIILPARTREELYRLHTNDIENPKAIRVISDAISSLTDSEAISTYSVLTGVQPGSIFDRFSL